MELVVYYTGFVLALLLTWGLGPVFFYPLLADLIFDVCGTVGLFTGWDTRMLMAIYGLAMLLWALAMIGTLTKPTFVAVLFLDLATIFYRIVPQFQMNGSGQDFWDVASAGIYEVWLVSIFVVVASMVVRSTVMAKIQQHRIDLLTNPKKRFLLPIGAWAGIPPLMSCLEPWLPTDVFDNRYVIASHVLVWGWVALELPPYITHKRLMKRIS